MATQRIRQIEKENVSKRGNLFNTGKNKNNENRVGLTFLFNNASPNVSKKMKKRWSVLNINMYLRKSFESKWITSFPGKKKLDKMVVENKKFSNKEDVYSVKKSFNRLKTNEK